VGKIKEQRDYSEQVLEAEELIDELMDTLKGAGDWKHVDTPERHGAIVRILAMADAYKAKWKA